MKTARDVANEIDAFVSFYGGVCHPSPTRVAIWLQALAERVAELESREEVRERIKPITEGRKPEPGVGR